MRLPYSRFTFGIHDLDAGFNEVPALVGLFAISELLNSGKKANVKQKIAHIERHGFGMSAKEFFGQIPNAIRSGIIGCFIGILPGNIEEDTMSFSSEVRTEILDNLTLRKKHRLAQGYGLLLCSKRFDADEISMTSETKEVAALYRSTLRDILGKAAGELTIARTGMGNATRHYAVSLPGREAREAVLCHFAQNGDRISEDFISGEGDAAAFLSGAYLACGSVTDPEKNYMLEFSVYRAGLVEPLGQLLSHLMPAASVFSSDGDRNFPHTLPPPFLFLLPQAYAEAGMRPRRHMLLYSARSEVQWQHFTASIGISLLQ